MKFFTYGSVLTLAISNALGLSISCMLESAKYGSCVTELKNIPDITSSESMNNFCSSLKKDGCKSFVADAGTTTTSCDINDENDKELASLIYTARIGYLAYCVTDKDGNQCPLSNFFLKQSPALNGKDGSDFIKPVQEDLNVFLEDCKKDECNARLVSLFEVTKAYNTAKGNDVNSIIPSEFDTILENYKNKKCDNVLTLLSNTAAANNITIANNTTTNTAPTTNVSADINENSGATTLKTISSTLSLIALLAIVFF